MADWCFLNKQLVLIKFKTSLLDSWLQSQNKTLVFDNVAVLQIYNNFKIQSFSK